MEVIYFLSIMSVIAYFHVYHDAMNQLATYLFLNRYDIRRTA